MKRLLSLSYVIWLLLFVVIPIILIAYYAFTFDHAFTLDNFKRALEPIYIKVLLRSINLAGICTVVCLIIGYPVAYIMSERRFNNSALLFLFLVPMWMNMLLRTYAWLTILEQNGLVNSFLISIGFHKINFLYRNETIVLGMVYDFLPFMILPIHTSLKKINKSVVEAAQDLGANHLVTFWRIVFPLSLSGVLSGITMVFMPAVTTFIVSNLLGGGKLMLIGNLIEQQFLRVGDWHFGSAISIIVMLVIIFSAILLSFADKNNDGGTLF